MFKHKFNKGDRVWVVSIFGTGMDEFEFAECVIERVVRDRECPKYEVRFPDDTLDFLKESDCFAERGICCAANLGYVDKGMKVYARIKTMLEAALEEEIKKKMPE